MDATNHAHIRFKPKTLKVVSERTRRFRRKQKRLANGVKQDRKSEVFREIVFAETKHNLLIMLQAMDTYGKDCTIQHLARGYHTRWLCNVF